MGFYDLSGFLIFVRAWRFYSDPVRFAQGGAVWTVSFFRMAYNFRIFLAGELIIAGWLVAVCVVNQSDH